MANRIREVQVHDRSVIPAEAEVWVRVVPERLTPATEVRGRLMGPRCAYASTVEVAYPLRPLGPPVGNGLRAVPAARGGERPPCRWGNDDAPGLTLRVVIPEASLW